MMPQEHGNLPLGVLPRARERGRSIDTQSPIALITVRR